MISHKKYNSAFWASFPKQQMNICQSVSIYSKIEPRLKLNSITCQLQPSLSKAIANQTVLRSAVITTIRKRLNKKANHKNSKSEHVILTASNKKEADPKEQTDIQQMIVTYPGILLVQVAVSELLHMKRRSKLNQLRQQE